MEPDLKKDSGRATVIIDPVGRTAMFWAANDRSWHIPETVAAVTGLSLNTLVNWRAQGKGPNFVKQGKLVYYRKTDVIQWLETFEPSHLQDAG